MGDRYFLYIACPKCGFVDNTMYAPTCGFVDWRCPSCEYVVDLEALIGISRDECSNADEIVAIVKKEAERYVPRVSRDDITTEEGTA